MRKMGYRCAKLLPKWLTCCILEKVDAKSSAAMTDFNDVASDPESMSRSYGLKEISNLGEDQLWSRISRSFAGRLAAILFFFYGFLVLATSPFALSASSNRTLVFGLGIFTMATGAVTWFIPWEHWPKNVTLVLPILAFWLISLLDAVVPDAHAQYSALFMVVFAWLGLCHDRGTSTFLLPLAAFSYAYSLVLLAHYPLATILGTAAYLVPSWWLLGETIAWVSSRLVKVEASLKSSEESFRQLFADNPQPMWIYDMDTFRFLEVNQATVDHYGFSRSEFLEMTLSEISLPRDDIRAEAKGSAPANKDKLTSYRTLTRSKGIVETQSVTHTVSFDSRPAILAVLSDVTSQNRLEDELRYQASHDSLTGLANRSDLVGLLDTKIGTIRSKGDRRALYLVLVDLDRFKDINYGLGHVFGDQVLIECANRLSLELPPSHSVARLGGDEFAIVISDETGLKLNEIAENIVDIIGRTLHIEDVVLRIDASMGIVEIPRYGVNAAEALRNADIAMYRAKREKRDWAIFNSDDEQDRLGQLTLGNELREAIEGAAIAVVFQPEINFNTGELHAIEALARWDHPLRGPIGPEIFIPIAEQIGVVGRLTTWVLDEALRLCKSLENNGESVAVALNVSAQLLVDPTFATVVGDALIKAGVASGSLVCEITESALIEKLTESLVTLERLRNLGVRISLDDFGTGYSSLSYLRDIPLDELKIDRAFITDLVADEGLRKIVKGIIEVGHALSIKVVAEGVEDEETASILTRMGCDVGQGYRYSRPLCSSEFRDWLVERQ